MLDLILTMSVIALNVNVLNEHYPIKLSKVMEIFSVCAIQDISHQLHVSTEHLNVPSATEDLHFKFYSMFLNKHIWLVATILDSTGLNIPNNRLRLPDWIKKSKIYMFSMIQGSGIIYTAQFL